MASNLTPSLSILFFAFILLSLPSLTISDDTCLYPCYPPPTGSGGTPVITKPPPSSQSGSYPPPGNYPSPTGNFPYNNYPPPAGSNNGNYYFGPPPPDPILPYFPFYYRKPPHQTDQSSATMLQLPRSTVLTATQLLFLLYLVLFLVSR